MSVRDVPQLAHFPPANAARFPLKNENRIIVIKPFVALLRWCQIAAHAGRDDSILLANQSVRLQSTPNVLIEPLNFVPCLRHDNAGPLLRRQCQVMLHQSRNLVIAFDDDAQAVEAVKRSGQVSRLSFRHRRSILLDPRLFPCGLAQSRILAADFGQFRRDNARILFNRPQGVRCFDSAMLAGVAGKDDPAAIGFEPV